MSTATLATWSMLTADAGRYRRRLLEQVREWGAAYHANGRALPSRWLCAWDLANRPVRCRIVAADAGASDRERAEAAADDLWDAVAVGWQFAQWAAKARLGPSQGLEHVVAELQAAGRWLAAYPVAVAGHDRALAVLFHGEPGGGA
jgi:hypothetical protein